MLTPSMALLGRSLRVESRQMRPHLFRLLFVGLMFFALWFAHMTSLIYGAPGLNLFSWIVWQSFLYITLAAIGFFATAISEEKDESTLGLLRMAGIGPVALLLGKSTTRLIAAVLVLAVQFPFTLLAITLGGVTGGQIIAAYAALLAYMVFVANLGLFCSVVASSSGRASVWTFVLIVAYFFVPAVLASVASQATTGGFGPAADVVLQSVAPGAQWLYDASITSRLGVILSTGFAEPAISSQVLLNLGAAVVLFLISWALFEPFARDANSGSENILSPILGTARVSRKSRRAWRYAIVWKDFYFVTGGMKMLLAKMVLYPAIVLFFVAMNLPVSNDWGTVEIGIFAMGVMLALIAVELVIYASRLFRDEVRNQTLSSLMMLPTSVARIGYSKAAGALLGLIPAVFYFLVGVACAPDEFVVAVNESLIKHSLGWYAVMMYIVFLHITVLMSLVVKWGALPLSFGIMYFTQSCFSPFLMLAMIPTQIPASGLLVFIPMAMVSFAIILGLQVFIHERLKRLAEQ